MNENRVKLGEVIEDGKYRAWYRCSNCGVIFQYDMQKGKISAEMNGHCPWCGVKSGTPKVGVFPLVKYNPEQDQFQRHYFR